jgi:chemotaxis protein MotA
MKLDLSTIIGLIVAWGLVFMGMFLATGGDMALLIALFINQPSSAAITIGGSIGGVIISFPFYKLTKLVSVFMKGVMEDPKNTAYGELIEEMVEYATEARRNGVLALDARTEEIHDPFIKKGIQLAVDGTAPEQIEEILALELEYLGKRHADNQAMVLKWAELAPAFGMIGTLIGLIAMLANLSDPDAIGPSMAIALITTLYGSMLANMFCIPIAAKLEGRTKEEVVRKEIVISAVLSIQNGDNPRIVQQKLMTYVPPSDRENISSGEEV